LRLEDVAVHLVGKQESGQTNIGDIASLQLVSRRHGSASICCPFELGQAFPLYLLPDRVSPSSGSALRRLGGELELRSSQLQRHALACSYPPPTVTVPRILN
jgi:hypothetical protein